MATALAIITDAMVEIGAYAPGDTISSVHQALGLLRFQNQLDAWQADYVTLNLQDRLTFSLTSGVSSFTIGPSGDLVTTRPSYIEGVNYVIPGTSPATEVPMAELNSDQYLNLSQKALTNSLPMMWYLNATATNATMNIYPVVTQTVTLALYLEHGIDIPATIATTVVGPQGYAESFMYNLALRLCGPMSRPIPEYLPKLARDSYANMVRPNIEPSLMAVDAALAPNPIGSSGFNVLTGQTSGASNGS